MKIDTRNMPDYLSESLFDSWYHRAMEHLDPLLDYLHYNHWDFYLYDSSINPWPDKITFSKRSKMDIYGTISLEKAKEKIIKIFPQEEVKENYKKYLYEITTREQLLEKVEVLVALPKRVCKVEYDSHEIYERIKEIAISIKLYCPRLGEYRNATREIVLYTKNIESSCANSNEYLKAFEKTVAHELFHFFHYYLLSLEGKDYDIINRKDATAKVIKESLASYFEYSYCNAHGLPFDKYAIWFKHEPSFFPYAGAKFIENDAQFYEIFELSSDFDAALRELCSINMDGFKQFYKIKNKG